MKHSDGGTKLRPAGWSTRHEEVDPANFPNWSVLMLAHVVFLRATDIYAGDKNHDSAQCKLKED
jgi:hypothetical protein